MFNKIIFDISGVCNAKCPYCVTGLLNLNKLNINDTKNSFIKVENFEKALDYLIINKIFNVEYGSIDLYNWGEPLIHPEFDSIVNILNNHKIKFSISTNASKFPKLAQSTSMENLLELRFSMSGFSQSSYDKIHQFNFNLIKNNIIKIIERFKQAGHKGTPIINYHIYQFNIAEYNQALNFAKNYNINIWPYYAYINHYELAKDYIDNSLDRKILKKASKDLMLFYVDELISKKPINYSCPQFNMLTIDENCNVLTCCVIPKGCQSYSVGNLFDLSLEKIYKLKTSQKECVNCQKLNFDFWAHNVTTCESLPSFIRLPEKLHELFKSNKQYETAWLILSSIYYRRQDLQNVFPMSLSFDIRFYYNLLLWAINAIIYYEDGDKSILEPYIKEYTLMLQAIT
ncbi:MAG: hypothetical protein EVJ46_07310 [Candidatus Acididesulfobacter guangdongensis]|uniref:Radical SAM core domain-containing protein n=1 Tax=Acididesulfobacter guangdongensis TaxID=2597225 RepID=A0A519BFG2_ACIG2|nr:MAG: hypothetical protein EVJ46_07310 [Candidatus Acididesulfobacter guangdongensis]